MSQVFCTHSFTDIKWGHLLWYGWYPICTEFQSTLC